MRTILCTLVVLTGLVAFRPWKQINQSLGIRVGQRSITSMAGQIPDSIFVQTAPVIVAQNRSVDTLVSHLAKQQNRLDSLRTTDVEFKEKEKQLMLSIKKREQRIREKQKALMSLDDIDALVKKQNSKQPVLKSEMEFLAKDQRP